MLDEKDKIKKATDKVVKEEKTLRTIFSVLFICLMFSGVAMGAFSSSRPSENRSSADSHLILPYATSDIDGDASNEWFYSQNGTLHYDSDTDWEVQDSLGNPRCAFETKFLTSNCSTLPSGLRAYYPLDNSKGQAWSPLNESLNGTLNGGVTQGATGRVNDAYDFDGTDDYVEFPANLDGTFKDHDFTFSIWIKPNNNREVIFNYGAEGNNNDGVSLYTTGNGVIEVARRDGGNWDYLETADVGFGKWNLVTFVWDTSASDGDLYVNATLDEQGHDTAGLGNGFYLGYQPNDASVKYSGVADDFRIWNKKLTTNEVDYIYNSTKTSYWGAEEVAGGDVNTAPDNATYNTPTCGVTNVSLHPMLNVSVTDADNDTMNVSFYNAEDDSLIGSREAIVNGSYANITYGGLTEKTTYKWYVNITDGSDTTQSPNCNFTTLQYTNTTNPLFLESGVKATTFDLLDQVTIKFNTTHMKGRTYLDNYYLSVIDPTGTVRVSNTSTLDFFDGYSDGAMNPEWTANAQYTEDAGVLKYGYSGNYKEETLVNETYLSNRSEGTVSIDFNVKNDAEHSSRILMRYQNDSHYVAFFVSKAYSVMGIEEIYKGVRYRTETSKPVAIDTWYDLKFSIQGNMAKGYFEGNEVISREIQYVNQSAYTGLMTDASETWYDNFTVGYAESTTQAIPDGYSHEYNYTIPSNTSLGGVWTVNAYAEPTNASLKTAKGSSDFTVAISKPYLQNQSTIETDTDAGTNRQVRSDIIHSIPAEIDTVYVNITAVNGTKVIEKGLATSLGAISDGERFEYNYTPPKRLDSEGTWSYTWYANDTDGGDEEDTASSEFDVNVPAPETKAIQTYNPNTVNKDVFRFNKQVRVRVNVTDENGASDLTGATITVTAPNSTKVIDTQAMTNITPLTGQGYIYEYNYTFGNNPDSHGKYVINITASDIDYSLVTNGEMTLWWINDNYTYRKKVTLQEQFDIERNEYVGLNITAPSTNLDCGYIQVVKPDGENVPYEVVGTGSGGGDTHCQLKFSTSIKPSQEKEIEVYYNATGTQHTYSEITGEITTKENFFTEIDADEFFDSYSSSRTTYIKGGDSGDLTGDGDIERIFVGQTSNETRNTYSFVVILNESGDIEFSKKWQSRDESGLYSPVVKEMDSDNAGEEVVIGGWSYDGNYNYGTLAIYDYDGASFSALVEQDWALNSNDSDVFATHIDDLTGDGEQEIVTGGRDQGVNNSYVRVWSYDEATNILSLQDGDSWGLGYDRDRIFSLTSADFDGDGTKELVGAGTTRLDTTNCEGGLMLNATIYIYNYTGGTLNREKGYSYHKNDLTEIFSITHGDVDGDGDIELITSGNWYNCTAGNDVAEVRVFNYSVGGIVGLENRQQKIADGHSSFLTVMYNDINNDFEKEIIASGFRNDGTTDRGYQEIYKYNGSFIRVNNFSIEKPLPIRDADYFDSMTITDVDGDGFKEITTGGRYGMSQPAWTYVDEREVGGVTASIGSEVTRDLETPSIGFMNLTAHNIGDNEDLSLVVGVSDVNPGSVWFDTVSSEVSGRTTLNIVDNLNDTGDVYANDSGNLRTSKQVAWNITDTGYSENNTNKHTLDSQRFLKNDSFSNDGVNEFNYSFRHYKPSNVTIVKGGNTTGLLTPGTNTNLHTEYEGDVIKNETNKNFTTPATQVVIGVNYSGSRNFTLSNQMAVNFTDVNFSTGLKIPTACGGHSDLRNVSGDTNTTQMYMFNFSCDPGQEKNYTLSDSTSTVGGIDYKKYTYNGNFNISSNETSDKVILYRFNTSRLTNWTNRNVSLTEFYRDSSDRNMTMKSNASKVTLTIGTNHSNSSLEEGSYSGEVIYYVETTTTTDDDDGGGSVGGDTTTDDDGTGYTYTASGLFTVTPNSLVGNETVIEPLSTRKGCKKYTVTVASNLLNWLEIDLSVSGETFTTSNGSVVATSNWISLSNRHLEIDPGESKEVDVCVDVPKTFSDYDGEMKVEFSTGGMTEELSVVVPKYVDTEFGTASVLSGDALLRLIEVNKRVLVLIALCVAGLLAFVGIARL